MASEAMPRFLRLLLQRHDNILFGVAECAVQDQRDTVGELFLPAGSSRLPFSRV